MKAITIWGYKYNYYRWNCIVYCDGMVDIKHNLDCMMDKHWSYFRIIWYNKCFWWIHCGMCDVYIGTFVGIDVDVFDICFGAEISIGFDTIYHAPHNHKSLTNSSPIICNVICIFHCIRLQTFPAAVVFILFSTKFNSFHYI